MTARRPRWPAAPHEHPWERARRREFAAWESVLRHTAYDRPLPDLVGFSQSLQPPPDGFPGGGRRRMFAVSALPTGGPAYLVSGSARPERSVEGRLVRVPRPVKRAVSVGKGTLGELVLDAPDGLTAAAWEDVLPGLSTTAIARIVPSLAGLLRLPDGAVEQLLLPIVGSLPWHGRPAGLDVHLEVDGWPLRRYEGLVQSLASLVPEWVTASRRGHRRDRGDRELASGARLRSGLARHARPFSLRLRPISTSPALGVPDTVSDSSITFGPALRSEFEARVADATTVVLLDRAEGRGVPERAVEVPDDLRIAVWGLHWWTPAPPDAPEWHEWLKNVEPGLQESLRVLRSSDRASTDALSRPFLDHRDFRDRLTQVAWARARLRGVPEVQEDDLRWAAEGVTRAVARAVAWDAQGRGPLRRALDRTEGLRTARVRRAVASVLDARPTGVTLPEALADLRAAGAEVSDRDVESQLERLRIRGVLFQDRAGRYRPV